LDDEQQLTEDGRKEEPSQHRWEIDTVLMTKGRQRILSVRRHYRIIVAAFTAASTVMIFALACTMAKQPKKTES
jgi:hypothetical protein